jgi:hypothetical protein
MIIELNLPLPSAEIVSVAQSIVKTLTLKDKADIDVMYSPAVSAHNWFFRANALDALVNKHYGSIFHKHRLFSVIGIMRPDDNAIVSCHPPHIDRDRFLAINYYLETGGNVRTVFYDRVGKPASRTTWVNYAQANVVSEHILRTDCWYAFDTSRAHSVEGIVSERFLMSIELAGTGPNYGVQELCNDYPDVLQSVLAMHK